MSGIRSTLARLFVRAFPSRASTQTWMILTFLFFIGIAVVAVGIYVTFVLSNEVHIAFRQTLFQEATRVADVLESESSTGTRLRDTRNLARFSDLRITVVDDDSLILDMRGNRLMIDGNLLEREEMQFDNPNEFNFVERDTDGETMFYVAIFRPGSGLTVRVGEPQPPLVSLITRLQTTMLAAMVMALFLALFGSWVASQQVTQPLISIRNSARSISEGDLDEEILVESRAAEFQDLAESLNHMSDAFKEKIEELQRLAQLQNEFIGNVSHEVRNPIFSIGGYLEALASGSLKAAQRKLYAEKGLSNLERLNNLFSDLIEIARLEYREDLIKSTVFELRELSLDVHELLNEKAERKGLELVFENAPVHVCADRSRMRQVLINLVDNAIAYSDEGSVRCRFRRHGEKVRVEVVDTGRGIPEEHLERIFERFHRVDPDRSRKSGGTGLGLSIVKQILHAHGETINVESISGSGTRFWFEIAFAPEEASDTLQNA